MPPWPSVRSILKPANVDPAASPVLPLIVPSTDIGPPSMDAERAESLGSAGPSVWGCHGWQIKCE